MFSYVFICFTCFHHVLVNDYVMSSTFVLLDLLFMVVFYVHCHYYLHVCALYNALYIYEIISFIICYILGFLSTMYYLFIAFVLRFTFIVPYVIRCIFINWLILTVWLPMCFIVELLFNIVLYLHLDLLVRVVTSCWCSINSGFILEIFNYNPI